MKYWKIIIVFTSVSVNSPYFVVIKMSVAPVDWKIGVGESAARSIERVTISVLSLFKPYFYVYLQFFSSFSNATSYVCV